MYLTFTCMFIMIALYTSLAWYNYTHPVKRPKRDKSRKHAMLRALLEQKRREEAKKNEKT